MTDKKTGPVIGFDLGGSKMMACVYDADYQLLGSKRRRTKAREGAETVFERLAKTIRQACEDAKIEPGDLDGIGIGSPGPLDFATGTILDTPNMGFRNFALRDEVAKTFDVPVFMDNDVNVGTYGEFCFGAGRGCTHMIGVFPGTGLGGGLILDGKLYRGATGGAGEVGHMIIQVEGPLCGCGQYGCLEALASRLSLSKEVAAMAMRGDAPSVEAECGTEVAKIKSKAVGMARAAGDQAVITAIERSAYFLGIGMANLVNILSPERIVIGGGLVEELGQPYVDIARTSMREHAMPFLVENVKVRAAELGDYAVVMGAARLMRESL